MTLNHRIILSATVVLVIFITLTAAALDRAFVNSTESAMHDRLTSQLYALLAAAEIDDNTVILPTNELDALLGLPSSGMAAFVTDADGNILWQSNSTLGTRPPEPLHLNAGEKRFLRTRIDGQEYHLLAHGIQWATDSGARMLTFNIATNLDSFHKQIGHFRKTLWSWLLGMAVLLLFSQALILRWGLSPLRRVGEELGRIENGQQQAIENHYPMEIERLTQNINLLLQQEREQKSRYRNALGDLAHSLKTPLAVIQSALQSKQQDSAAMQQQIARMNEIVEYQLQRAVSTGSARLGKAVDVNAVVQRMSGALQKVYRDKNIQLHVDCQDALHFRGDEGDLMELIGNPLDNAFKWAKSQVRITLRQQRDKLHIEIADDGPGIPGEQIDTLLQRGHRADQSMPGHGIGLSIVRNLVDSHRGELRIEQSELGGARVVMVL